MSISNEIRHEMNAIFIGWYYNAIRDPKKLRSASKKYQNAIQKVLKCDPKSTKMRSKKY